MLGIYEASIKKISFETGIPEGTVSKDLKAFESLGKVRYLKNFVVLTNFIKHQNYNPNMKKAAVTIYNDLPQDVKIEGLTLDETNPLKAFESLCKGLGMVRKVEVEVEVEKETEKEVKIEEEPLTLSMPFETLDFINIWEHWKEYKKIEFKFSYKSVQSQQAALNELANMANGQEHLAIAIIKQSMANGWKGFVNLKGYQDGKPKQQAGQFSESAARERFNKYSQS